MMTILHNLRIGSKEGPQYIVAEQNSLEFINLFILMANKRFRPIFKTVIPYELHVYYLLSISF